MENVFATRVILELIVERKNAKQIVVSMASAKMEYVIAKKVGLELCAILKLVQNFVVISKNSN